MDWCNVPCIAFANVYIWLELFFNWARDKIVRKSLAAKKKTFPPFLFPPPLLPSSWVTSSNHFTNHRGNWARLGHNSCIAITLDGGWNFGQMAANGPTRPARWWATHPVGDFCQFQCTAKTSINLKVKCYSAWTVHLISDIVLVFNMCIFRRTRTWNLGRGEAVWGRWAGELLDWVRISLSIVSTIYSFSKCKSCAKMLVKKCMQ